MWFVLNLLLAYWITPLFTSLLHASRHWILKALHNPPASLAQSVCMQTCNIALYWGRLHTCGLLASRFIPFSLWYVKRLMSCGWPVLLNFTSHAVIQKCLDWWFQYAKAHVASVKTRCECQDQIILHPLTCYQMICFVSSKKNKQNWNPRTRSV